MLSSKYFIVHYSYILWVTLPSRSHWIYFHLNYKAKEAGMRVDYVDPAYTSQKCSRCSYTSKRNRKKSEFLCRHCCFSLNADLIAARNISNHYIDTLDPYQLTYLVINPVLGAHISIPDVTSLDSYENYIFK